MENKKNLKKVITISFIILLLCAGTAYALKSKLFSNKKNSSMINTAKVIRGNIETLVAATGTLQPLDYVDVGAQVSGQLKKIHVEVGSEVKTGDLLAEIDPTLFTAQVDSSRAQLRYQRAQLKDREAQLVLAENQLKRQKNLFEDDATTLEALQNAEASHKTALAQLEMLKAQIDQTESGLRADEANLNYTKIFAPMDGTIVTIVARQGQTLNANQSAPTILQIADLSTMTVQTQVSEADIVKLKTDMRAYFTTLGSNGKRWYGKLRRIEPTPTSENNVVLYNALFDVENNERNLLPQMTAQVFFITESARNTLLVPASAVNVSDSQQHRRRQQQSEDNKQAEVTIVKADGTTETKQVKTGIVNRIQAEILEGLEENDTILITSSGGASPYQQGQQPNTRNPSQGFGPGIPGIR